MPSQRASLRAPSPIAAAAIRVLRFGGIVAVSGIALFCVALLLVRFVVFPHVEAYRDDLTATLSAQLSQPVEIDRLSTGWDGWNPKVVIHGFRVRSGSGATPLLDLPEIDLIIAWTSLPALDLRLKQLVIAQPRLAIRRDRSGMLRIAGMEFDPGQVSDDSPIAAWLLRQPHIDVHDALITWNDDQRNAPQLVLDHVEFRLESRFGRHRFGLRGTPPTEIAAPIDVRGDFRVASVKDLQQATGKIYARLDYADIAAWSEWLPLPVPITSGQGALRLWADFGDGGPKDIVADLELKDVKAKLAAHLPELDLASLSGRVGWRVALPRQEFYARHLAFVTAAGQRFDPTDFALTWREASGGGEATGLIEFDQLQLAPLRDLAVHLPLPESLRADLALYAPRGTLTRGRILWEGPAEAPSVYNAAADFADVGIAARGKLPGIQGLSGRVEMTQAAGDLKLASRNVALELTQVLADPVPIDRLQGDVSWEHRPDHTVVRIERLEFASEDTSGRASGQYRTAAQGPGTIDVNAQLSRINIEQVHRYLPIATEAAVRDWLRAALTAGSTGEVRLKLAGSLAEFPYPGGKGGQFTVATKVKDGALDYAHGWPPLSELDADVRLDGTRLTVDATRGRVAGIPLGKFSVGINDLRADHPLLVIDGAGTMATADVLHFIGSSPVAGWIDHYTDGAQAAGSGRLELKVALPLGDVAGTRVTGEYVVAGNEVRLVGAPPLTAVNGKLQFSEKGVVARDVAVEVLGGPARIGVTSDRDEVRLTGSGSTTIAALRREYSPPFGDAVSGSIEWTVAAVVGTSSSWSLDSTLKGTAIDLPAPLGKAAGETMPLRVERRGNAAQPNEDTVTVTYGQVGRLLLHRKLATGGETVDRALFLLGRVADGGTTERADRPGLWVRGALPALNLDDWLAVKRRVALAATGAAARDELEIAGIDLDVAVLEAVGRRFNEMKVSARRTKDDWRLDLRAKELAGTATWSAPSTDAPNGRLSARLARFLPPDAAELPSWQRATIGTATKVEAGADNPWPEIDVRAEAFFIRGRDAGQLEFVAHPRGTEWRIDKLALANDGGRLDASGHWQSAGKDQQTRLDIAVSVTDAGKFLSRIGYLDAVQEAPTKVNGTLEWAGAPSDFDYPTLSGAFRVDVGPGRFTKIEPGVGKLLGVLSLQSLPRRITLDFTDVFSEGFAFDEIAGDVRIQSGVLKTANLRLSGPAAKVEISGDVDLARETQQLAVRVLPALSASISTGAALLFLANPIIGAAIGAGSLLAQKVLRDPFEQMFSYEYEVTGSWTDPVVTRPGAAKAAAAPAAPTH
jgi:uncharacterized protein (TIGR02099 family)